MQLFLLLYRMGYRPHHEVLFSSSVSMQIKWVIFLYCLFFLTVYPNNPTFLFLFLRAVLRGTSDNLKNPRMCFTVARTLPPSPPAQHPLVKAGSLPSLPLREQGVGFGSLLGHRRAPWGLHPGWPPTAWPCGATEGGSFSKTVFQVLAVSLSPCCVTCQLWCRPSPLGSLGLWGHLLTTWFPPAFTLWLWLCLQSHQPVRNTVSKNAGGLAGTEVSVDRFLGEAGGWERGGHPCARRCSLQVLAGHQVPKGGEWPAAFV